MEHSPYASDLAPKDIWLLPKIKSALKEWRFQDNEDIQKGGGMIGGSSPGRDWEFSSSPHPDRLWGPSSLLSDGY
jgi:hypothetical protein